MRIESFTRDGGAKLDISSEQLELLGIRPGDVIQVTLGNGTRLPKVPVFTGGFCQAGQAFLLVDGQAVILSVRRGNFKERYEARLNHIIELKLVEQGGVAEQENAYSFDRRDDPKEFGSVEEFANFRELSFGKLRPKVIYRSASPFDDIYHRADAVARCMKKRKVRTVLDMADTETELEALVPTMPRFSAELYQKGQVIAAGDDSGYQSREFAELVAKSLKELAERPTPYLIHCRAGKRRSGFVCAIFGLLAGASEDEIVADYMLSYKNNNGVTREDNPSRYDYLAADTIGKMIRHIETPDVESFLRKNGLPDISLAKLKQKILK